MMAKSSDWFPHKRVDVLALCRVWLAYITAPLQGLWGIPTEKWTALQSLFTAAESWLEKAQDIAERTHVVSVACHEAFAALEAKMRFFKDRYFKIPPLTKEDLAALGLKEKDAHRTPIGKPTAQVMAKMFLRGPGELGIEIVYVSSSPDDRANKGYRVWYSAVAPGETPPASPDELRKSFFTQRKKDYIEFDYTDAGKTAYIAVQIESGPMMSAVIPGSK
jgi:hypothetical protein